MFYQPLLCFDGILLFSSSFYIFLGVATYIFPVLSVGWEPSMQDDAQGLRPGADACVEQV